MFEALFILTIIDAGTRVGRFMLQDLGKHAWEPFGRVSSYPVTVVASAIIVAMWGYFLYQGVRDPLGGINSLWPLFGISNQLLATIALAVGTTIIIKMDRAKYAFVTLLPLAWLVAVTMTAGWQKIFSANPKLGFLSHASLVAESAAAGKTGAGLPAIADAARVIFNDRLDAAVAGFFLIAVVVILIASLSAWIRLLRTMDANRERDIATERLSIQNA
jgi:carbon starvation protein